MYAIATGVMKFLVAILLSTTAFGQISTLQTSYIFHTNRPGTIELENVLKGDWLRIIVRWNTGGAVVGVFTDNFFDPWYPSILNTHGAINQEEFESISRKDGDLVVNLYLYLHENIYYDIKLEEISHASSEPWKRTGQTKGPDEDRVENQNDPGPDASLTNSVPDTPQPASLGMLALGAQGVPLWRRRELLGATQ
jgi:hypothetical protein